jgi:hypothetical protein
MCAAIRYVIHAALEKVQGRRWRNAEAVPQVTESTQAQIMEVQSAIGEGTAVHL